MSRTNLIFEDFPYGLLIVGKEYDGIPNGYGAARYDYKSSIQYTLEAKKDGRRVTFEELQQFKIE